MERRQHDDGTVTLSSGSGVFTFATVAPGVLLVTVRGSDTGQFGTAVLDELHTAIQRFGRLALFIDARETVVTSDKHAVPGLWAAWLTEHADSLDGVHVLADDRFTSLVLDITKHVSRLRGLRVHRDLAPFEERLRAFAPAAALGTGG